ncbi:hypothetical protein OIV19_23055 [Brucella sp. HL-2]|nr:hypothetical protein [Brucella sp. HL-2]MCV9910450.1 hypothetical protein [Brucella sp. HL-2]
MKKIVLIVAALVINVGSAFAENPHVGEPANLHLRAHNSRPVATRHVDQTTPALIKQQTYSGGSAHRFGDASPSSYQK